MDYKMSVLICHLPDRGEFLTRLYDSIRASGGIRNDIEILIDDDTTITTGAKRNKLLQKAKGKYVAFVDDDDMVTDEYFMVALEAIERGFDCCALLGIITDDGKNPRQFVHSIQYTAWDEKDGIYRRPPNHLNIIRADIAKQFEFPDISHGEDKVWSMALHRSGLLKTEMLPYSITYLYLHRSKK